MRYDSIHKIGPAMEIDSTNFGQRRTDATDLLAVVDGMRLGNFQLLWPTSIAHGETLFPNLYQAAWH